MKDKYHKFITIKSVYLNETALEKMRNFFDSRFSLQNRKLEIIIKLASGLNRVYTDFNSFIVGLKEFNVNKESVIQIDICCSTNIDNTFRASVFFDIYFKPFWYGIGINIHSSNFYGRSKDWVLGTLAEIDELRKHVEVPKKKWRGFHADCMAILDLTGRQMDDGDVPISDKNRQTVARKVLWYKSTRWWVEKVVLAILLILIASILNKYFSGKVT